MRFSAFDFILNGKHTFVTNSAKEFEKFNRRDYSAACLEEPTHSGRIVNLRDVFNCWPARQPLKFYCDVLHGEEIVLQGAGQHLPTIVQNEVRRLASLNFRITGSTLFITQIQKLSLPKHSHIFPVINTTIGGEGTAIVNADGTGFAAEGDTVFMNAGVSHYSCDLENMNRYSIVVFDPTPRHE